MASNGLSKVTIIVTRSIVCNIQVFQLVDRRVNLNVALSFKILNIDEMIFPSFFFFSFFSFLQLYDECEIVIKIGLFLLLSSIKIF